MNFADFKTKLAAEADDIRKDVSAGMADAARLVLADSQQRVPVITGELRDSGTVVEGPSGATVAYTADYAGDVHDNPNSSGFGYLQHAVDAKAGEIPDIVVNKARLP